jgi:hypothetical protein
MKIIALMSAIALSLSAVGVSAQSDSQNIRVAPGHFCSQNKCVRFSSDLQSVSIQARTRVSVAAYELDNNPVLTRAQFSEIFALALRQNHVGTNR